MSDVAFRAEAHFSDRIVRCRVSRPPTVGAMLAAAAAANPNGDALVDGAVRLSHADLARAAAGVAGALAARGVEPGDRVGLIAGNRWPFVLGLLGILRAGAIAVPVSIRSSAAETAYALGDSGARMAIADEALAGLVPEGTPRLLSEELEGLAAGPGAPEPQRAEEDCAVILYTSGTTGRPKGAMLTHLNLVHSSFAYIDAFGLGPADRTVVAVPASHVTGLVAGILTPLACGGAVVMLEKFEVEAFLTLAAAERMSFTVMVPAMYNLCLMRANLADHDLSAWRVGSFGGAPMPVATIERMAEALPGLTLAQAYGSTETASPATIVPLGAQAGRPSTVGRPVPHADILVVDPEGREVPTGESGEIWIGGPMVVPGYWKMPEKTAESFQAGYWKSGDLGRFDEGGFLYVHDRIKDMINRGGYKVWSAEVENALAFHPGVAEAAVIGFPDPVLGEKTRAIVVSSDPSITAEALKAHCRSLLADYKTPDVVEFRSEPLPRNPNGKVMKQALRSG